MPSLQSDLENGMHRWIGAALAILITGAVAWAATAFTPVGSNNVPLFTPTNPGYVFSANTPSVPAPGDHPITTDDCGKTVVMTGAFKTATLPVVGGFKDGCTIRIVNGSLTRAQSLVGFPGIALIPTGCGGYCLWPGGTTIIAVSGGNWQFFQLPGRYNAGSGAQFYIAPGGLDTNDCLSPSGACATAQRTWSYGCYQVDGASVVQVADGTYNIATPDYINAGGGCISPQIQFIGNTVTPANIVLNLNVAPTPGQAFVFAENSKIVFYGFTIHPVAVGPYTIIGADNAGVIDWGWLIINNVPNGGAVFWANDTAAILSQHGPVTMNDILGGTGSTLGYFVKATKGGQILMQGLPITFVGTAWADLYGCWATDLGNINMGAVTGLGLFTSGTRWNAEGNGNVASSTLGALCPGTVNGTTGTGGQVN